MEAPTAAPTSKSQNESIIVNIKSLKMSLKNLSENSAYVQEASDKLIHTLNNYIYDGTFQDLYTKRVAENVQLKNEIERLKNQYSALNVEQIYCAQLETEKQQLETEKQQLETEKQQLKTKKQQLETENKVLKTEKQQLETEKQQLEDIIKKDQSFTDSSELERSITSEGNSSTLTDIAENARLFMDEADGLPSQKKFSARD